MEPKATQYLTAILTGLVTYPEAIKVNQTADEMGVLLTVSVHAEDMGRVIGRSGETAKSIRRILKAHGFAHQQNVSMKVMEPA